MSLFSKDENNLWIPHEITRGPFAGLQGGGISALMCEELIGEADTQGFGQLASLSVQFLRPTPERAFSTMPAVRRVGRRSSILMNKVVCGGQETAIATANFIVPSEMAEIDEEVKDKHDPARFEPAADIPSPHGKPWMMDAFEVRAGDAGIVWFKQKVPLLKELSLLSALLIVADWTHGLNRPAGPALADPNVNLNVTIVRIPQGEYVGIRGSAQWTQSGLGLGYGEIYDQYGRLGVVSMSTVLTAL